MKARMLMAVVAVLALAGCQRAEEAESGEGTQGKGMAGGGPSARETGGGTADGGLRTPGKSGERPPRKARSYKYAKPVRGKPGYVLNPFNGNEVDVRGIPADTLVRDPQDPDPDHKFRLPPVP